MKKILIIEDSPTWQGRFREILADRAEGKIILEQAYDMPSALALFEQKKFDLIAIDGCLTGDTPDGLTLAEEFRKTFDGPMLAISTSAELRQMMKERGCNEECKKEFAPEMIMAMLGLR